MNTCDTCKWWTKNKETGWAENAMWMGKFGTCDKAYSHYEEWPLDSLGSNSYEPDITTGPKFGCIHHERKEVQGFRRFKRRKNI